MPATSKSKNGFVRVIAVGIYFGRGRAQRSIAVVEGAVAEIRSNAPSVDDDVCFCTRSIDFASAWPDPQCDFESSFDVRSWHVSGNTVMGAVTGVYVRALAKQAGQLSATTQYNLHMHLCAQLALPFGPAPPAAKSRRATCQAVQRERVLGYIEAHFGDPLATAECSQRIVHRRLTESHNLLHDPANDRCSIAEIAFQSGFQ